MSFAVARRLARNETERTIFVRQARDGSGSGDTQTIILSALRAAIAIASESGAKPLQQKAEAMLTSMLAGAAISRPYPGRATSGAFARRVK